MARFIEKKLKRLDLAKLFGVIKEARSRDASGNVTFTGERFFEAEAILSGAIDVNPEIHGSSRESVKIQGIRNACKDEDLSKDSLIAAVRQAELEYLRKPRKRFAILGNITIQPGIELSSRHFRERHVRISFPAYRPANFQKHPEVAIFLGPRPRPFGRCFRASVWARTPEGAITRALRHVDLLRALWNIAITRNQQKYFNYQREPLNSIIVGPVYTAHTPRGKLAERRQYWFEPGYCYDSKIFGDPFRRWDSIEEYERAVRTQIKRLPTDKYRDIIVIALIRYVRALDGTIWEDVIFRLWSILELLTGCKEGDNYDTLVRRVAGIFVDFQYHKQVLESLRNHRNEIVHEDAGSHRSQDNLYLLKRYVEKLIEFHLGDGSKLGGFENVCEFLELPNDREALNSSLETLKKEVRLRELLIHRLQRYSR